MISDPLFYYTAIPAVLLIGLSKGGFGGIALLGVPLISLVISPVQAAGIMLPILIVMDIVALLAYRGTYDAKSLKILIPAGMLGVGIGWATAAMVSPSFVRLIVGLVAFAFALDYFIGNAKAKDPAKHNVPKGTFWGAVSGFTSFVSHAGSPPFQMYMLPLRLDKQVLAGTSIIQFSVVNAVKVIPYFFLGQFDATNLTTSAVLLPLAPIATLIGVRLVKVVDQDLFYRITYICVFLVSFKLIWDGVTGML